MEREEILKTEYSYEFDELRKNRMATSYFKYGSLKNNYGECLVKAISELENRLKKYKETGNVELLIDVANFAMIEFMCPKHKDAHFNSEDHETRIQAMTYKDIEKLSRGE